MFVHLFKYNPKYYYIINALRIFMLWNNFFKLISLL